MKLMENLKVQLEERSYDIIIAAGVLKKVNEVLADFAAARRCLIVTDSNVQPLYESTLKLGLAEIGAETADYVYPAGEEHKTPETVVDICRKGVRSGLDRKSLIVALGGGVCGDMAGFAAAMYMRGIGFIQIPTTLLSMVDSSVGGKTGTDLPEGKNLIGAFWQPQIVVIDPETLKTLPAEEVCCGLAEVVKYGMILDEEFFSLLEKNIDKLKSLDMGFYTKIIRRCCELKAEVVSKDEREGGLRAILNYGHTFGHALELLSNFEVAHGKAVSMGMAIAAELAADTGRISKELAERQNALLKKLDLPVKAPAGFDAEEVYNAMMQDKKTLGKIIRVVLPDAIGKVSIVKGLEKDIVTKAIRKCCE
ncbi:MAG: 3-dehydroquinate synthase [Lentisphaerae bacterium]|nr:3-dehydroquinate synthase [Lentisphaerota bacterium]MCP4100867.1 3-dehydroquinate synthase [Lentisphaerota bacterium]